METIEPVSVYPTDVPTGITESGMVVGTSGGGHATRAWVWTPGSGTLLLGNLPNDQFQSTNALDVNERGEIAGMRGNGGDVFRKDQAVRWTPEGWMGLLAPANSFAAAINDSGKILWTPEGGMVDLGTLPGAATSEAFGINDNGQVVGTSGGRAFLWTPADGMAELTPLPPSKPSAVQHDFAAAYSINNHGQIAGTSADRAVMWFGDTTQPTAQVQTLRGERLADVRSRGLRLRLTTSEPGGVEITLSRAKRTLATKTVSLPKAATSAVTFKLDHKTRVGLRILSRATFTLRTVARDLAGNSSVTTTKLTLKR
jgi:probable HAF family extracellular repeat protein